MKRRFVVGVDGETQQDVDKIVQFARDNGIGWYHWIDNFWLFTSRSESITAGTIRDELRSLVRDKHLVVLQVENVTWATFGPKKMEKGGKNISLWIRQTWSQD